MPWCVCYWFCGKDLCCRMPAPKPGRDCSLCRPSSPSWPLSLLPTIIRERGGFKRELHIACVTWPSWWWGQRPRFCCCTGRERHLSTGKQHHFLSIPGTLCSTLSQPDTNAPIVTMLGATVTYKLAVKPADHFMKLHMVVPVKDPRSAVIPGPQVVSQSTFPVKCSK